MHEDTKERLRSTGSKVYTAWVCAQCGTGTVESRQRGGRRPTFCAADHHENFSGAIDVVIPDKERKRDIYRVV